MDVHREKLTLKDIYGPDHVFNPRSPFSKYGWLPTDPITLDFMTGSPLPFTGELPIICSRSVSTNEALSLLRSANIEVSSNRYEYHTEKDYQKLLYSCISQKQKLVFNHLHPMGEMEGDGYWIDPELLSFFNNKANLAKLVPIDHIPKRSIINPNEWPKSPNIRLPIVIKAATDEPNGGGYGVDICLTEEDVIKAHTVFSTCPLIVVEEYIPIKRNYSVQFARTFDNSILYLGASEQIISKNGHYLGNWIEKGDEPPEDVIQLAQEIMCNASLLGYYGIAGFDIVLSDSDRAYVIDLNFRWNGSTGALLLSNSLFERPGPSTLLFRSWKTKYPSTRFIPACKKAIIDGFLLPLSLFLPEASPFPHANPRITGVAVGSSRRNVIQKTMPRLRRQLKIR